MSRLIDGDHLEERVRKIIKDYAQAAKDTNTPARVIFSSCGVIGLVKSESTVDAVPVRHGRWRNYEGMLTCSECGMEFYDDIMEYCGDHVPKFCPDCGARMDGKGNNG